MLPGVWAVGRVSGVAGAVALPGVPIRVGGLSARGGPPHRRSVVDMSSRPVWVDMSSPMPCRGPGARCDPLSVLAGVPWPVSEVARCRSSTSGGPGPCGVRLALASRRCPGSPGFHSVQRRSHIWNASKMSKTCPNSLCRCTVWYSARQFLPILVIWGLFWCY